MDLNNLNLNEQKEVQKIFDANAFKQKTIQELTESPEIQKFLDQFRLSDKEEFIKVL